MCSVSTSLHPKLPSCAHKQMYLWVCTRNRVAGLESLKAVSSSLKQPHEEGAVITPRFSAGKLR